MDYFMENNKFLSLKGILNRRNFIINFLIIEMIEGLVFVTPLFYALLFNPKLLSDFTSIKNNFPEWYLIIVAVWGIIYCLLFFPSMVRRVRDVIGVGDNNRITLISVVITVIMYASYTPIGFRFLGKWLAIFVVAILATTIGKISGDKPKSPVAKFNWGAFFGTWIWGLFNKTYITLFMIPLSMTLAWFPFMLICGLKGNEWSYENKKIDAIDKFHKSQANQATIFGCLAPIFVIVILVIFMLLSGIFMLNYTKSHPDATNKINSYADSYTEAAVKSSFSKVELGKDENKFYMEPSTWSKLSNKYKIQMLNMASTYAKSKENNSSIKPTENNKFPIPVETMNKTKIYSTFNNEVLAEFYLDLPKYSEDLHNAKTLTQIMNLTNKGYKFNNYPSMP